MREHLRTTCAAPQNARIGQVADHATDAGVVPHFTCPCPVAEIVQVGCDPLCAEPLMHILIKDCADNSGFGLIDDQLVKLMLALVQASTFYKVVTIGGIAALKAALLYKLAQRCFRADRGFLAFAVRLPEADIVGKFVGVIVKPLFALLGAPYAFFSG